MFDCGKKIVKSQVISGQLEKFVRLDSMDSRYSQASEAGLNKCTLNLQGATRSVHANNASSGSFKKGFRKGSKGDYVMLYGVATIVVRLDRGLISSCDYQSCYHEKSVTCSI